MIRIVAVEESRKAGTGDEYLPAGRQGINKADNKKIIIQLV